MSIGRIVKLTDFTKDATVLPSDVASGKVFYGSEGRRLGTLSKFHMIATALSSDAPLIADKTSNNGRWLMSYGYTSSQQFQYVDEVPTEIRLWIPTTVGTTPTYYGCIYDVQNINRICTGFVVNDGAYNILGMHPYFQGNSSYTGAFRINLFNEYVLEFKMTDAKVESMQIYKVKETTNDAKIKFFFAP